MKSIMGESWREIEGFPNYEISNFGRIKNIKFNWFLKPTPRSKLGYQGVCLYKNGKMKNRYIHRLVLGSFVGPCPPNCEGSHKDGNVKNNLLSNLVWETRKENHDRKKDHGTLIKGSSIKHAKLNETDVWSIRFGFMKCGEGKKYLQKKYGLDRKTIEHIIYGRNWKHVKGFVFYKDNNNKGSNHGNSKLTERHVIAIREKVQFGWTYPQMGAFYDISPHTVGQVVRREVWKHV